VVERIPIDYCKRGGRGRGDGKDEIKEGKGIGKWRKNEEKKEREEKVKNE
jgi:hypothetical protein